jgi:hypothetical protein
MKEASAMNTRHFNRLGMMGARNTPSPAGRHIAQLEHGHVSGGVPPVLVMIGLIDGKLDERRPVDAHIRPAVPAHAVIDDADTSGRTTMKQFRIIVRSLLLLAFSLLAADAFGQTAKGACRFMDVDLRHC